MVFNSGDDCWYVKLSTHMWAGLYSLAICIPTIFNLGYGLVYYDKAILGSAVLFGMTRDLHLSVVNTATTPPTTNTSRLSWATSMFYFGMLAGLYPMTFALQRFNLGRILGGVVVVWALVCMLTAAVTSYHGLYAQRFFLGFVESIVPTGFMCIISGYYTQEEQALRQSWWFSSTGLFTIVGGALNYGFAQITGGSLKRWQYIYLLAGCLTFLFGVWCFFIPNSPVSAWFLTPAERIVAVERLRRGQTGVRCQQIKMSQLKEALLDLKVWLVFILMASLDGRPSSQSCGSFLWAACVSSPFFFAAIFLLESLTFASFCLS